MLKRQYGPSSTHTVLQWPSSLVPKQKAHLDVALSSRQEAEGFQSLRHLNLLENPYVKRL